MIKSLAFACVIGYVVLKVARKEYDLVDCNVFFIPFFSVAASVGLMLTAYQLIAFIGIILILMFKKAHLVVYPPVVLFLSYLVISSTVVSLFFIDFLPLKVSGFYRVEGRFILQLIMTIFFQFSLFFVIINYVKDFEKIKKVVKVLLFSTYILGILGIIQWVIYFLTKFDIFQIGFLFELVPFHPDGKSAIMDNVISQVGWVRSCSLGGEPKHFANALVVGFFTSLAASKMNLQLGINHFLYNMVFIMGIIFSLSSTGIVLTLVGIPLFYIIAFLLGSGEKKKLNVKAVGIFLFLFTLIALNTKPLYKILEVRVLERELTDDGADGMTQDFLLDQKEWSIFGTGIGNLHNKVFPYTRNRFQKEFYDGNVFIPATYLTKLVTESGFVGLFFFLLIPISMLLQLLKNRNKNPWVKFFIIVIILLTMFTMSRYAIIYYFLVYLGLAYCLRKHVLPQPIYST